MGVGSMASSSGPPLPTSMRAAAAHNASNSPRQGADFPVSRLSIFSSFFLNISCYPSSLGGQIIGWFSFGSISSMCIFFNQQFHSFPWKRRQGIEVTGASAAMNAQQSFFLSVRESTN
jgi:hypothetical protein